MLFFERGQSFLERLNGVGDLNLVGVDVADFFRELRAEHGRDADLLSVGINNFRRNRDTEFRRVEQCDVCTKKSRTDGRVVGISV